MKLRTNNGRSLESLILASPGVCLVKIPSGTRWLRGSKMVRTKSPVDFMGCFPGGMALALDAKQCDLVHRFPVGNRTHVPDHQRDLLIALGRAGATAGLIVEATRHGKLYWCDWTVIVMPIASVVWEALYLLGPSNRTIDWKRLVTAETVQVSR